MNLNTFAVSFAAFLSSALLSTALAAPVGYTFSTVTQTQIPPPNNPFNPNGSATTQQQIGISNSIALNLAGTSVSGSFFYDTAAMRTGTTGGGPTGTRGEVYGGHFLPDGVTPYSSFTSLSGSVNGGPARTFTDPRGYTAVTDDGFQLSCFPAPCTPPPMVDSFEFGAESTTGASIRNIAGFNVAAGLNTYSLFNVRLFWIETFLVPVAIPDLFSSESLPGTPPPYNGRLALTFVASGDTNGTGTQYLVFYDNLFVTAAIPEPETYALLLAGLGLLGFAARRKMVLA